MTISPDHEPDTPTVHDASTRRSEPRWRWLAAGAVITFVVAAATALTYALWESGPLGYVPLGVGCVVAAVVLTTHGAEGGLYLLGASLVVLLCSGAIPSLVEMGAVVLSDDDVILARAVTDSTAGFVAGTPMAYALLFLLRSSRTTSATRR